MSVIYCNIDMFALDQIIYEEKDGNTKIIAKVPFNNLSAFITRYCNENNITEIHLGGFTEFTADVRNKILENNKTKFKNNTPLNVILEKKGNNNE